MGVLLLRESFLCNIFRCGDSIILRYSCDWKIVTREESALYKEEGQRVELGSSTVPCPLSPTPTLTPFCLRMSGTLVKMTDPTPSSGFLLSKQVQALPASR